MPRTARPFLATELVRTDLQYWADSEVANECAEDDPEHADSYATEAILEELEGWDGDPASLSDAAAKWAAGMLEDKQDADCYGADHRSLMRRLQLRLGHLEPFALGGEEFNSKTGRMSKSRPECRIDGIAYQYRHA